MNNAWITISTVSSVFLWNKLVVPTDRWPIMIFSKICFACAANLTRKATEAGGTRGILDASQNAAYEEDSSESVLFSPLLRVTLFHVIVNSMSVGFSVVVVLEGWGLSLAIDTEAGWPIWISEHLRRALGLWQVCGDATLSRQKRYIC